MRSILRFPGAFLVAVLVLCGPSALLAGEDPEDKPVRHRVVVILEDGTRIEGVILGYGSRVYQVEVDGEVREIPEREVREVRFGETEGEKDEGPGFRLRIGVESDAYAFGEKAEALSYPKFFQALRKEAEKTPKETFTISKAKGRYIGPRIDVSKESGTGEIRFLVNGEHEKKGPGSMAWAINTLRLRSVMDGIAGDGNTLLLWFSNEIPGAVFLPLLRGCWEHHFETLYVSGELESTPFVLSVLPFDKDTLTLPVGVVEISVSSEAPWSRVLAVLNACGAVGLRDIRILEGESEVAKLRLPLLDRTDRNELLPEETVSVENDSIRSYRRYRISRSVLHLGSDDPGTVSKAREELISYGYEAMDALRDAAQGEDPDVRGQAASLLAYLGESVEGPGTQGPNPAGVFGFRTTSRRNLRAFGGGRHTESAVLMGLIWLKNHQNPDGTWSCKEFMNNCPKGICTGAGSSASYDIGLTGLTAMAFLGAGHTHERGKFKDVVKRALGAMKERQDEDGCFCERTPDGRWIYNHAICTQAMAEAFGMTRDPAWKTSAQKAAGFLVTCQNPGAGWRYGVRPGESDSSCTAWAVCALKAAELAGLEVPKECFEGAIAWFDRVTDDASCKTGYRSRGDSGARLAEAAGKFEPTEAMTAAAVFCRILIKGGRMKNHPFTLGGGNRLKQKPPKWDVAGGAIDLYYWYWGTLAMFQLGRQYWKAWNDPMKNALIPTQRRDGCENGSWDPVGAWGAAGGRVYATAMNVLTLEIYYRYKRFLE